MFCLEKNDICDIWHDPIGLIDWINRDLVWKHYIAKSGTRVYLLCPFLDLAESKMRKSDMRPKFYCTLILILMGFGLREIIVYDSE